MEWTVPSRNIHNKEIGEDTFKIIHTLFIFSRKQTTKYLVYKQSPTTTNHTKSTYLFFLQLFLGMTALQKRLRTSSGGN